MTVLCITYPSFAATTTTYNVISFGAKPNGVIDSIKAFLNLWSTACASTTAAMIQVPKGRYLLGSLVFRGTDCKSPHITFKIDGTLVAPVDHRILGQFDN